jgi:hypothetical protein
MSPEDDRKDTAGAGQRGGGEAAAPASRRAQSPGAAAGGRAITPWQPAAIALAASFLLHAVTVLWVWQTWSGFGRGGVLAWIDFPSSLVYLRWRGGAKLAWSLLIGGAQWAVVGAGLSLLVGRSARAPAEPRD